MSGINKSPRKGKVIKTSDAPNTKIRSKIRLVSNENGGLNELRQYNNGSIGAFFKNGKFRFITGSNKLKPRVKGSKLQRPNISPRSAVIALQKYYRNRDYKSQSARKAALTRRVCSDNKPHTTDTKFKNAPHRWEYTGVTDGSRCPHDNIHKKRVLSNRQKRSLLNRIKRKQNGGGVKMYKDNAYNRKLGRVGSPYSTGRKSMTQSGGSKNKNKNENKNENENQQGGERPISLKKAVSLLRQYYEEKYGGGEE